MSSLLIRQMDKKIIPNKPRVGLYGKFYQRLVEIEDSIGNCSKKNYIPFPKVFEKVCRGFSIKKSDAWEVLFLLRDVGLIEIIKFKGIKLNVK